MVPLIPSRADLVRSAALVLLALATTRVAAQDTGFVDGNVPIVYEMLHPCTGELVKLEGHFQVATNTTVTEGGDAHVMLHFETHGMSATTSVNLPGEKPRKYVSDEVVNDTAHFRGDDPPSKHIVTTWTFLRTGEDDDLLCCGDDFKLHVVFRLDRVGNVVTARLADLDGECR